MRHRVLNAVRATSSTNAWAVGRYNDPSTNFERILILRWNGTALKRVARLARHPGTKNGSNDAGAALGHRAIAPRTW